MLWGLFQNVYTTEQYNLPQKHRYGKCFMLPGSNSNFEKQFKKMLKNN